MHSARLDVASTTLRTGSHWSAQSKSGVGPGKVRPGKSGRRCHRDETLALSGTVSSFFAAVTPITGRSRCDYPGDRTMRGSALGTGRRPGQSYGCCQFSPAALAALLLSFRARNGQRRDPSRREGNDRNVRSGRGDSTVRPRNRRRATSEHLASKRAARSRGWWLLAGDRRCGQWVRPGRRR